LIPGPVAGVGHFAVQLGKSLGLFVVAVAGPSNVQWLKESLGADEVVDYSKQVRFGLGFGIQVSGLMAIALAVAEGSRMGQTRWLN
jgi:NADPH:quinone reductase-like Zn-dependent oxidoreductase